MSTKRRAGLAGFLGAAVEQMLRNERGQAARKADQPAGVLGKGLEIGPWLVIEALQVGVGDELKQVLIAREVPREQAQVEDGLSLVGPALALEPRALDQVELAADDRLDPLGLGRVVELDRAEKIAVVGQRRGPSSPVRPPGRSAGRSGRRRPAGCSRYGREGGRNSCRRTARFNPKRCPAIAQELNRGFGAVATILPRRMPPRPRSSVDAGRQGSRQV